MTINLLNSKCYIGRDANDNPSYLGSGVFLKQAVKKYGKENFKKVILERCTDKEQLRERERYWIEYHNAVKSNYFYNMSTNGGFGGKVVYTDELRKIASEQMKRFYLENFGEKGLPKEWRDNLANTVIGRVPWNKGKKFIDKEKKILYENRKTINLSDENIIEIREMYENGYSASKIASKFNKSHHTILKIVRREGKYSKT